MGEQRTAPDGMGHGKDPASQIAADIAGETDRLAALRACATLDTVPDPAFDQLVRTTAAVLGMPLAMVSLIDSRRQWIKSAVGIDAREIPREVSLCAQVMLSGSPLVIDDALADPCCAANPLVTGAPGLRSYAGAPIRSRLGFALGTLAVADTRPRNLGPDQVRLLGDLAVLAADLLDQRMALHQAHEEARRGHDALATLAQREAELRAILDNAADGIVMIDESGIVRSINSSAQTIFGYTADEVIGRNISMLMPEPPASTHDGYMARYLGDGTPHIIGIGREVKGRRRDGSTFPMHLAVSEMRSNGRRLFTGIVSDLTTLKEAQRAAEKRGGLLNAIIEASPDAIFVKDLDGRYLLANKACATVMGADMVGRTDHDLLPSDAAQALCANDRAVLERRAAITAEEMVPTPGGPRTFLVTKAPLIMTDGAVIGVVGVARDMSERIKAQRDLEESNRLLALAEEVAHVGHWYYDPCCERIAWSPMVYRIHGVDPVTFVPTFSSALETYHPEDRAALRDLLVQAAASREEVSFEARVVRPDGTIRHVMTRAVCGIGQTWSQAGSQTGTLPGLFGAVVDITELKQAEQALHSIDRMLHLAINNISEGFVLYDPDDRMVLCNDTYRHLFSVPDHPVQPGQRFDEVLRRGVEAGLFPEASGREEQWLAARVRQHREGGTFEFKLGQLWIMASERRLPDGYIVGTRTNVTALKKAQEVADKANQAKSEFLSSMSHELRTPLNAILGFAQLLTTSRKDPLSDKQRTQVGHIIKGGEHLLRLINEVLDLARIESGSTSLSIETVDTGALIEDCLPLARSHGDRHGITVINVTAGMPLPAIRADFTRTKQVLLNLLSNAVKYNRPGGTVRLSCQVADGTLRFAVADTGPGIPPERQGGLFQPFNRLGQEMTEIEGTGIGLTITKRLIEQMQGRIGFTSQPGEGSVFWFELPLADEQGVRQAVSPRAPTSIAFDGVEVRTLLYIEDNPANLTLMQELLDEIGGFLLLSTHTAELGIELARSQQPDVIIMDINLPGMDGFNATKRLKELPETAGIPVIALSANATPGNVRRSVDAGFFEYLTKPVNIQELLKTIDLALRECAA